MARTTPVRRAWRSLAWLGIIILGLVGLNVINYFTVPVPTRTSQAATFAPKLGLDLIGGTEIILQPELAKGKVVTDDQLQQAVAIIRERIDAAGVSEPADQHPGNRRHREHPGSDSGIARQGDSGAHHQGGEAGFPRGPRH
ncbi:MAG: hypothetical protein WDM88_08545 [Galbitalea sp.]